MNSSNCSSQYPERRRTSTGVSRCITVLALALFLFCFIFQVRKNPLRMDEVDFFQCMKNTVELGAPIWYAGEVNIDHNQLVHLSTQRLDGRTFAFYRYKPETGVQKETFFALTDANSQYIYGLWHPPLYIYLGALYFHVMPLTPDNSSLLRYFNLTFSIGTFIGMAALCRELYPRWNRQLFPVALLLYALNSLAVRGSILIDYNATLGPCVATWLILTYLQSERCQRFCVSLVASTILALFTGLGIAASLLISISVYALIFGWRQKPWHAIASIAAGIISFFPLFWIFCRVFNLPFSQPFLHNISRANIQLGLPWLIQLIRTALRYGFIYSREISHSAVIVCAVLFARTVLTKETYSSPRHTLLPITVFTGLVSQASLGADAYGFVKYVVFLLPMLFVYLAGEGFAWIHASRTRWQKAIPIMALGIIALTSCVNSLQILQQPGGTLYLKGEQGVITIAQSLESISDPDEVVLSPRDIAFFANRKFVRRFDATILNLERAQTRIEQENVEHVVVRSSVLSATSDVAVYLQERFSVRDSAGDYVLFERRDNDHRQQ